MPLSGSELRNLRETSGSYRTTYLDLRQIDVHSLSHRTARNWSTTSLVANKLKPRTVRRLAAMNQLLNPDELFNEKARLADLDTSVDKFHDLILAAFQSNVREAYQQYLDYPDREPNTGLVHNAAAWIQELLMPDVAQRDIAQSISRWIVKEAAQKQSNHRVDPVITQEKQSGFLPFM